MQVNPTAFVTNLEEEFENLPVDSISTTSFFREVPGWSSMMALILIAKIDSVYSVTISAAELAESKTVQDLLNLVERKVAA